MFQACLPSSGPGALAPREDLKALGTERERTMFVPQDDFYKRVPVTAGGARNGAHSGGG